MGLIDLLHKKGRMQVNGEQKNGAKKKRKGQLKGTSPTGQQSRALLHTTTQLQLQLKLHNYTTTTLLHTTQLQST